MQIGTENLNTLDELLSFAKSNYPILGIGTSRAVFNINDKYALKIAKSEKGLAQNKTEARLSNKSPLLAKIIKTHPKNFWILMEIAENATEEDFKRISKIDIDDLFEYLLIKTTEKEPTLPPDLQRLDNMQLPKELLDFALKYNLAINDLYDIENWGIVKRNNTPTLVIVDFGVDLSTWYEYYSI